MITYPYEKSSPVTIEDFLVSILGIQNDIQHQHFDYFINQQELKLSLNAIVLIKQLEAGLKAELSKTEIDLNYLYSLNRMLARVSHSSWVALKLSEIFPSYTWGECKEMIKSEIT